LNIFIDLDGTLINSKVRLYNLFQDLVPNSSFTFYDYWRLKEQGINHSHILINYFDFNKKELDDFQSKWMQLIETDEYTKFDAPFNGVSKHLLELKKMGFLLYIVTSRQYEEKAISQIKNFGWSNIFNKIIVTQQKYKKEDLISSLLNSEKNNYLIGDTGLDIKVGKKLKMKTVAVLTGFLNEKVLKTYNPDYIYNSILDFKPTF